MKTQANLKMQNRRFNVDWRVGPENWPRKGTHHLESLSWSFAANGISRSLMMEMIFKGYRKKAMGPQIKAMI